MLQAAPVALLQTGGHMGCLQLMCLLLGRSAAASVRSCKPKCAAAVLPAPQLRLPIECHVLFVPLLLAAAQVPGWRAALPERGSAAD